MREDQHFAAQLHYNLAIACLHLDLPDEVLIAAPINIHRDGEDFLMEWEGEGWLQTAENTEGPWEDIPDASSPFRISASPEVSRYFRLSGDAYLDALDIALAELRAVEDLLIPKLTVSPVLLTRCPSLATRCPPAATACPALVTGCPSTATRCPALATGCPSTETICPAVATKCPAVETRCPPLQTRCPAVNTACPAVETLCPSVQTQCPPQPTLCQVADTICPALETKWGDKVPVLLDGESEICHYFLAPDQLALHLAQP